MDLTKCDRFLLKTDTHPTQALGWVRVTDTGPGIPSEHLDICLTVSIAWIESRTRNNDAPNDESAPTGSGLGLAIVEGIAKLHDGSIEVQSEPGKGSMFEITFPLYVEPAKPVINTIATKAETIPIH